MESVIWSFTVGFKTSAICYSIKEFKNNVDFQYNFKPTTGFFTSDLFIFSH